MQKVLAIALAGSLGALSRYGIAVWINERVAPGFPWSTFLINITGAFILGLLTAVGRDRIGPVLFLAMTTGFLGAYTTFSTYTVETLLLLQRGQGGMALGYLAGSAALGVLAAGLGYLVGSSFAAV